MYKTTMIIMAVLCLVCFGCGNGDEGGKNGGDKPGTGGGTGGAGTSGGGGGTAPEKPTPPAAGGGIPGTYVLDKDSLVEAMEKAALAEAADSGGDMGDMGDMMGDAGKEEMLKMVKAQAAQMAKSMNMEVTLKPDGTFAVGGSMMGDEVNVSGEWEVEGDKITFRTLMEDGVEKDELDEASGTVKDGVIHFKPDPNMPFEMVLRKK